MFNKLILNDMKKNKLMTVVITLFIVLAALLTSLAAILSVNLLTAMNSMMEKAKTPHLLQMHSGDINREQLADFADKQRYIEDFQVLSFLNIEGTEIIINGNSLADSVQDNGLSVQSERFDLLFDLNGHIIHPADGEIFVPIYYLKEGQARIGDKVTIHGESFIIAGFVRDSVMNASIISSKRFVVSKHDFQKLWNLGRLEHLIEFRLTDPSVTSSFEAEYLAAGLPSNGPPAITYSLFSMANAITDGMMIAVLILMSMLVLIINFLCIRFTLLAKVEEDYREIGVLKAIGLRVSSIKKLYLAKYGFLAGIACLTGFLLSLFVKEPLMENIRLYMGKSDSSILGLLFGIIGALLIFVVVMIYINGVLRRFKKISPAEAIRFGAPQEKYKAARGFGLATHPMFSPNIILGIKDVLARKKLYSTMLMVLVISSFLMIVPQNIYNTISQRNFMTYMGIGECDMRIDIQQTGDIKGKTAKIAAIMEKDTDIKKYTVLENLLFDIQMEDHSIQKLKVELGDHSIFPIEYSAGKAPLRDSEIAISTLVADDLEKGLNDTIMLIVDGEEKSVTICGIYSDITNGGKTAKAVFETNESSVLWSVIPVKLEHKTTIDKKIASYKNLFSYAKISDIDDYISQTFGGIISAVKKASYAAIVASALLTVLVTLLFIKMLVTKDRHSIAVLKSLGYKKEDIRSQYTTRSAFVLGMGVLIGTLMANTLGELVGVGLISSFGASTFHFEINPLFAYLFSPVLMTVCVYMATQFGISDISSLKISDYIKE